MPAPSRSRSGGRSESPEPRQLDDVDRFAITGLGDAVAGAAPRAIIRRLADQACSARWASAIESGVVCFAMTRASIGSMTARLSHAIGSA